MVCFFYRVINWCKLCFDNLNLIILIFISLFLFLVFPLTYKWTFENVDRGINSFCQVRFHKWRWGKTMRRTYNWLFSVITWLVAEVSKIWNETSSSCCDEHMHCIAWAPKCDNWSKFTSEQTLILAIIFASNLKENQTCCHFYFKICQLKFWPRRFPNVILNLISLLTLSISPFNNFPRPLTLRHFILFSQCSCGDNLTKFPR